MDALSLLQPLNPPAPWGGWLGGGLPSPVAEARASNCNLGSNPLLGDPLLAGERATQWLLVQVLQMLAQLLQNQAGSSGAQGQNASSGQAGATGTSGGGGGQASSSTGRSSSNSNAPPAKASGQLVERQGKKIDASIAGNFDAMVAAAKRDGVDLRISSGYRSRQEQEVLYQKYLNGTGNLAAKPGTSNHESGLAIDFQGTPGAFAWLKKNATRYGLKNLPSEPWHYSVNGR